mmetsp:Transcript_2746/g.8645  ORF Transcript_2746/g.8645 Transcript_2746/m.8645 type:complete len:416 (+) Transcript_2746:104-1351(+)
MVSPRRRERRSCTRQSRRVREFRWNSTKRSSWPSRRSPSRRRSSSPWRRTSWSRVSACSTTASASRKTSSSAPPSSARSTRASTSTRSAPSTSPPPSTPTRDITASASTRSTRGESGSTREFSPRTPAPSSESRPQGSSSSSRPRSTTSTSTRTASARNSASTSPIAVRATPADSAVPSASSTASANLSPSRSAAHTSRPSNSACSTSSVASAADSAATRPPRPPEPLPPTFARARRAAHLAVPLDLHTSQPLSTQPCAQSRSSAPPMGLSLDMTSLPYCFLLLLSVYLAPVHGNRQTPSSRVNPGGGIRYARPAPSCGTWGDRPPREHSYGGRPLPLRTAMLRCAHPTPKPTPCDFGAPPPLLLTLLPFDRRLCPDAPFAVAAAHVDLCRMDPALPPLPSCDGPPVCGVPYSCL